MKRLLIVSLLTLVPILSGCCRGRPRMSMYRGDACSSCAAVGGVPALGMGTTGNCSSCGGNGVYAGGTEWQPSYEGILPAPAAQPGVLPGPVPPAT